MPGFVPGIHVFAEQLKAWNPSPIQTKIIPL